MGQVQNCTTTLIPEDQKMPPAWDWVEDAQYQTYFDATSNLTLQSWIMHVRTSAMMAVNRSLACMLSFGRSTV